MRSGRDQGREAGPGPRRREAASARHGDEADGDAGVNWYFAACRLCASGRADRNWRVGCLIEEYRVSGVDAVKFSPGKSAGGRTSGCWTGVARSAISVCGDLGDWPLRLARVGYDAGEMRRGRHCPPPPSGTPGTPTAPISPCHRLGGLPGNTEPTAPGTAGRPALPRAVRRACIIHQLTRVWTERRCRGRDSTRGAGTNRRAPGVRLL